MGGRYAQLHAALADLAPKVLFCDPERHARIAGDGAPDCVMVVTDSAPAGSESYAALVAQPAEPPPVAMSKASLPSTWRRLSPRPLTHRTKAASCGCCASSHVNPLPEM